MNKWDKAYMDTAERFAQLSYAQRLKVGALIVKDHRIISIGYNGTPAGVDNTCEDIIYMDNEIDKSELSMMTDAEIVATWPHVESKAQWITDPVIPGRWSSTKTRRYRLTTKNHVIHAEANALIKLARDGESGKDSTLYVTHAPCIECAKMIHGTGVKKVVYKNVYRTDMGIRFLKLMGIEVEHADGL